MKSKDKLKWFDVYVPFKDKMGLRHRAGNMIGAIAHIMDNIIIILSFGTLLPYISWNYIYWRLTSPWAQKWLYEHDK